jgi:exopolysaccharide biosynthesis protein
LSIGPALVGKTRNISPGSVLQLSTASAPNLRGIRTAIGGGPILIRDGQRQRIRSGNSESYVFTTMKERHPRAGIGWNQEAFYLVEVDGRQRDLSVGMTLDELGAYMSRLGCTDGMTLDGGGSATLWFKGSVRNSPCDGYERNLANSLVVVRKKPKLANAPEPAEEN